LKIILKKTYNDHSSSPRGFRVILEEFLAAVIFYTVIPLPGSWPTRFYGIARYAPWVGFLLGSLLLVVLVVLGVFNMPFLTASAVVLSVWVGVTGGLHLDGAMDTADGLAVLDADRRLIVMADSRSGAFGVMAAGLILILKLTALSELDALWTLPLVCAWGRWAQLAAIVRHPYIKPQGKGAFHRQQIRSPRSALVNLCVLLGLSILLGGYGGGCFGLGCGAIGLFVGDWFNRALGGQTGDTYGAIVEWTEVGALLLGVWLF
jgi:adenosylcobinamide-GDP ribazoletransferase